MGFEILPMVEYDGVWSIDDMTLTRIWDAMEATGIDKVVFFGGTVIGAYGWLQLCKSPLNMIHFVIDDNKTPVFCAWLNNFGRNHAVAHFFSFPSIWGKHTEKIGRLSLNYWFNMPTKLEVLIGEIPSVNTKAIEFAKRMGFTEAGEIPNIQHGDSPDTKCGRTIVHYVRGKEWDL